MTDTPVNRRDFVKTTSAVTAAGLMAGQASALAARSHAGADDLIRIGLVGCGGRGTGAVLNSLKSSENVQVTALADVFERKVRSSRAHLEGKGLGDAVKITDEHCYHGLDAYKKLIRDETVDVVLLATPPGFRPIQLRDAVEVGKHCFIEKPVCVDPVGYRSILESARMAREKGLCIVAGTQFRRSNNYIDAVRAIHDGKIGTPVFAQARYCSGGIWYRDRQPGETDAEYQMNNWYHFLWICGDQIVEQAIHNIDAINWAMGGPPVKAFGSGGQRLRPADSEIYDCMTIDFEYANGAVCSFMCRQQPGGSDVSNKIVGTKGTAIIMPFDIGKVKTHAGETLVRTRYKGDSYVQEHADLIAAIRSGNQIVEAEEVAHSSLTGVMGRMAAYTGKPVTWDFVTQQSKLDLMPADLTLKSKIPSAGVRLPGREELI